MKKKLGDFLSKFDYVKKDSNSKQFEKELLAKYIAKNNEQNRVYYAKLEKSYPSLMRSQSAVIPGHSRNSYRSSGPKLSAKALAKYKVHKRKGLYRNLRDDEEDEQQEEHHQDDEEDDEEEEDAEILSF